MRTHAEMSHELRLFKKDGKMYGEFGYKNIFDTKAWTERKQAIADRVKRNILKQRKRKELRLKKLAKAHV